MTQNTWTPDDNELNLVRRLAEAEDTLSAIRGGEVDAVVVDGASGQQIYTLQSPDEPFRVFVEQMQEGALTLNGDGTIIYCNRFFADLVGRPLEQVRGQSIEAYILPRDLGHFTEMFQAARSTVHRGECWIMDSRGEGRPVQLAFNPLPSTDLQMFGVVVTDLTERERAKQLEAARLAAEEANAARDQFLAVVSHELRTPLNAVLGWTQLLRQQQGLPSAADRGLQIIERSAWAQAQLIDDLLDVSRILAGKLRLDLRPLDLSPVVEASVGTIQPEADAKNIALEYKKPDKLLRVRGDPDRLQQVIVNLLSNAVKFTPTGGRVTVRLQEANGTAELQVIDTGIGIPPEYLPQMFELYRQIEGSTTRRTGGLGLGLAIVKELTEIHGGTVAARSAGKDQGSTFVVRLPLLEANVVEQERVEPVAEDHRHELAGARVLLVEDEEVARDMLAQVLQLAGAQVVAVGTAGEALQVLGEVEVDLMVSDIGLPGMDGYELIRKVRAGGRSGRTLPAIALTAFAGREDRRRALLAGYQVHISKPVDQHELYAAISSLAGKS
ncbi:ATP-binding protein [Gilvimarinus sp. F26214L]|uniref:ATP-binding protein n=1 Tax=Gilvimarinus sp. DZF01 TaxID=3461371 RepID=UPI004045FC1A